MRGCLGQEAGVEGAVSPESFPWLQTLTRRPGRFLALPLGVLLGGLSGRCACLNALC